MLEERICRYAGHALCLVSGDGRAMPSRIKLITRQLTNGHLHANQYQSPSTDAQIIDRLPLTHRLSAVADQLHHQSRTSKVDDPIASSRRVPSPIAINVMDCICRVALQTFTIAASKCSTWCLGMAASLIFLVSLFAPSLPLGSHLPAFSFFFFFLISIKMGIPTKAGSWLWVVGCFFAGSVNPLFFLFSSFTVRDEMSIVTALFCIKRFNCLGSFCLKKTCFIPLSFWDGASGHVEACTSFLVRSPLQRH